MPSSRASQRPRHRPRPRRRGWVALDDAERPGLDGDVDTDDAEVRRLGNLVRGLGGEPADCPVSGGCHRAETGTFRSSQAANVRLSSAFCAAHDHGAPDPAYGRPWLGIGPQGDHQLPGHRQPGVLLRSSRHGQGRGPRPEHHLGGHADLFWELLRSRDREPGDLERFSRHLVHHGTRAQGHRTLPEDRRSLRRARGTQPCPGRHLQGWRSALRRSRVVTEHRPPPGGRHGAVHSRSRFSRPHGR